MVHRIRTLFSPLVLSRGSLRRLVPSMSQTNTDYRPVPSLNSNSLMIELSNEPDQDALDSIRGEVSDVRPFRNLLM
jgi:hypothetical protein